MKLITSLNQMGALINDESSAMMTAILRLQPNANMATKRNTLVRWLLWLRYWGAKLGS